MGKEVDPNIGRVVGFQVDEFMYIATIIAIDDEAEQFTVRTEDGQELTGPFGAVFLDPHDRLSELQADYESLGNGKFRAKQGKGTSNWAPVPDPSLRAILGTSGSIIGVALAVGVFIAVISLGAIRTQIDSGDWVETEGRVVDTYNAEVCSSDGEGGMSCTSYTSVTVAYTYAGQNYTTEDYSMLSNDWLNGARYWNEVDAVKVYVNPDQPAQAVHVSGWEGVLEEALTLLFFTGIILGGYLVVVVPVWFVYAKIQRITGIEAPEKKKTEADNWSSLETNDNRAEKGDITETGQSEIGYAPSAEDEAPQEEKFW